MRIIDVHNHFYPPAYIDALRSGKSAITVKTDSEGNPEINIPAIITSPCRAIATSRTGSAYSSKKTSPRR